MFAAQNDPQDKYLGDIFYWTAPIPQWHALDQTLHAFVQFCVIIHVVPTVIMMVNPSDIALSGLGSVPGMGQVIMMF